MVVEDEPQIRRLLMVGTNAADNNGVRVDSATVDAAKENGTVTATLILHTG